MSAAQMLLRLRAEIGLVGIVALVCTVTTAAATIWLATEAGVPSETAVPIIVVLLLALRLAVRRNRASSHQS